MNFSEKQHKNHEYKCTRKTLVIQSTENSFSDMVSLVKNP